LWQAIIGGSKRAEKSAQNAKNEQPNSPVKTGTLQGGRGEGSVSWPRFKAWEACGKILDPSPRGKL